MTGDSFLRTFSVARKELLHILRDPQTLFFTIFVPVLELFMLGYAIDTNVRNVRTAFVDYAGTQESRQLLEKFEKSQDFRIVAHVHSDAELSGLIVAGKARVGIKIPEDYSRRLQAGQTAEILVLVDGTGIHPKKPLVGFSLSNVTGTCGTVPPVTTSIWRSRRGSQTAATTSATSRATRLA